MTAGTLIARGSENRTEPLSRAPLALAALLAFGAALVPAGCTPVSQQREAARPLPATPEELLTELNGQKEKIDAATVRMLERIEQFNASRPAGARKIRFGELFAEDLSEDQRGVLNAMIAEEQDVSYRSLLERIIADRDQIRDLQAKVLRLEQALPDQFVLVRKGDTHYRLATEFLTARGGVDRSRIGKLLARVDLTDELLPGNKVWFFYDGEKATFRTYVTMGEAGRTPLAVRRAAMRHLISERDAARAAAASLERARDRTLEEVAALEGERTRLEVDIAELRERKADLEENVGRLAGEIEFRDNALFYHAATVRDLKDQGVITRVLKRAQDFKGIDFNATLDLRRQTTIRLSPERFGLESISKVLVLPEIYREGRDFTVDLSESSGGARVVILDSDRFRGKEVILAVGGRERG
ncbi:MAG: hypothetical protein ACE5JH_03205 [Acidobacteriota bacterium]